MDLATGIIRDVAFDESTSMTDKRRARAITEQNHGSEKLEVERANAEKSK